MFMGNELRIDEGMTDHILTTYAGYHGKIGKVCQGRGENYGFVVFDARHFVTNLKLYHYNETYRYMIWLRDIADDSLLFF